MLYMHGHKICIKSYMTSCVHNTIYIPVCCRCCGILNKEHLMSNYCCQFSFRTYISVHELLQPYIVSCRMRDINDNSEALYTRDKVWFTTDKANIVCIASLMLLLTKVVW